MAARRRTRSKAAPGYIPELDLMEAKSPPTGAGWVHEVKWDGFRAQAHLRNGKVTTYSRSGLDWTQEFDTVSEAVAKLEAKSAVIDGEVVVIGPGGKPDFQALRRNLNKHSRDLQYYLRSAGAERERPAGPAVDGARIRAGEAPGKGARSHPLRRAL